MPRRPAQEEEEEPAFSESDMDMGSAGTKRARRSEGEDAGERKGRRIGYGSDDADDSGIDDAGDKRVDVSKLSSEDLKLERIVAYPTWREMLLDLVASKKLDPWNIDIVEVASGYIDKIKKMEMLDLRIPANLILAAAILIRFKSDALRFEEEAQMPVEETYVEEGTEPEVIPVLELKTRIPPKRMVTLDELLLAMEKVFEEQKIREEKAQKIEIPSVINIQLPEMDIEQRMAEVYGLVLERKDSEGLATFSSLLEEKTPFGVISTLIPVLHLVQDRRLSIFQEQFFGEIFIRVREEAEAKKAN